MDPIAFSIGPIGTWGPLDIRWYGIMMALSMLIGAWVAAAFLRRHGRSGDLVWDGLVWIIAGGVLGARFAYVITNLGLFFGPQGNPWEMFKIWHGGLSFHGGIIAGLLVAYFYFANKDVAFIEVMDAFAPGISIGVILVRLGNFMNGDILGYKWDGPWAMDFPHDYYHNYGALTTTVLRHPTELYGMLVGVFCLLVSIVLLNESWVTKRFPIGTAYLGFVLTYSLTRSFIEDPFRDVPLIWQVVDPAEAGYGLFTYSQAAAVVLIIIALWGMTQLRKWQRLRSEAVTERAERRERRESRQVERARKREERKRL